MKYIKSYKLFESDGPDDPRNEPIDNIIKQNIWDSFRNLEDIIGDDAPAEKGIKIGRVSNNDVMRGAKRDFIKVNILPKYQPVGVGDGWQQRMRENDKVKHFKDLSYTRTVVDKEFIDEMLNSMHQCAGFNNFTIPRVTVAYANGGEVSGGGELMKSFTPDGNPPGMKGAYNMDYLEEFLKEKVVDRLRWMKIFYKRPE